jgi:hypothetical protein
MKELSNFINNHFNNDKGRSSFSNLVKKIKLENELFVYIENYINFGTFKQKLHHYINNIPSKVYCESCKTIEVNWVEGDNKYRNTCSSKCSGLLTGKKRSPKRKPHPDIKDNKDFIEYFSKNKIKLSESSLVKVYPDLVKSINSDIKFDSNFPEKVYFYLYDLESRPKCKHCLENMSPFDTFSKGYHNYCSVKCSSNSIDKKNRIKDTCVLKYGVENIGSITRGQASETMNEKYGGHISTTKQYKEKYKETCLERYSEEHIFKTEDFKTKTRDYFKKNYGEDWSTKNKEIIERILKTKKEKGIIYKWSDDELKDIKSYRRAVSYYTEKSYIEYKNIINPDNLERGLHTNHIDHIFPVIEGWKNGIDPKILSRHENLRLIDSYENLSKGERTDISLDEFIKNSK